MDSAQKQLGHYEILSKLGAGGMGEVYLAKDTRLDRVVALKILPPHVAADHERMQRFRREAKTASALNHPNVATIYDVGESSGTSFIAMEYVEGETLADRIHAKAMPLHRIVEIGIEIAEALAAAHAKSIAHRDIKPENIMIRHDGYVKVLDFGLAKLAEQVDSVARAEAPTIGRSETDPGLILGTVQYMSPEQARGQTVDLRTDVFSLGVVLYEMIARHRPFEGATRSDVLVALLTKEPAPLSQHSGIPGALERIVQKALQKDRDQRYQTVDDLLEDLRNFGESLGRSAARRSFSKRTVIALAAALVVIITAGLGIVYFTGGGTAIESVAVLPFVNVGADPETEYLADGITESIINNLSQLTQLKVMSRNTVFRYKGRDLDPQIVGRELQVQAILLGRVVPRNDQLVISLELIDTSDNRQLWGEQYNKKPSDLLQIQAEISGEVSDKLRLRLSGEERKQIAKRYTEDAEAYLLYQRGRYHWNKFDATGFRKAIEYFSKAVEKDPAYALAYAGLADSYNVLGTDYERPHDVFPKAKVYAEKAVQMDPALAEARVSLATYKLFYEKDLPGSEAEFLRAIALNPNSADARHFYGHYLQAVGRLDDSVGETKRGLALDPLSLVMNAELAWAHYYAGQYSDAMLQNRKALEMDSNFAFTYINIGAVYSRQGKFEEAITELQRAIALSDEPSMVAMLGHVYAKSGRREDARKLLAQLIERSKRRYVDPYLVAFIYVGLDDRERTLEWLDTAYKEQSAWLIWLNVDPMFDHLRNVPQFTALVRRIGLAS